MFAPEIIQAAKQHAIDSYPRESCGYVANDKYVPQDNEASTPQDLFVMHWPTDVEVQAIIHSHPSGNEYPGAEDMAHQIATAVPWGIIITDGRRAKDPLWFGDQVPIPELVGREFVHGVTDCYSIIRDYYRLHKDVTLLDFPRDPEWWLKGGNLYEDGFAKAGFTAISQNQAKEGDVFLACVRSMVPNHGGVLLANGLALHHLQLRLSREEPIARWLKYVTHWLRYTGNENDLPTRQTKA